MISFTDQIGHTIELAARPTRIVSLVPSQTELLFSLGLGEEVVGITKFCVHPQQWFQQKRRVGGTKQVDPERVRQLNPDLIIANKAENVREQVEELAREFPVWTSDVSNLDDAIGMIGDIGAIASRERNALNLINRIHDRFSKLAEPLYRPRVAYLIWREPLMTVGGDTFIHDMLQRAGFENVFASRRRYPALEPEQLRSAEPEIILLPSEPFPFRQRHAEELRPLFPKAGMMLVDGEMFSWYGSRLAEAATYFFNLRRSAGRYFER